jgi:diacylglycerol kinase
MALPKKAIVYHPVRSFRHALQGLQMAFTREPNLTIQVLIGATFSTIGVR